MALYTPVFKHDTYGPDGPTRYARRPDCHLRWLLNITWPELREALGSDSETVARHVLEDLLAGRTTKAEILAPLERSQVA